MSEDDKKKADEMLAEAGGDARNMTPDKFMEYMKYRLAALGESGSWFQNKVAAIIGAIILFLNKTMFQKIIISWASMAVMWGFASLVKASPGRAFELMKKISSAYYTPPEEWAGFIASYMEQMTGAKISMEDFTSKGVMGGGRAAMEKLGEAFVNPLLNLIMPEPPITPQDGIDAAERYLGVNLQFQMSAWFLHVMGDMMSFGIFKSLKDLPNAISWSFGLGWLSWLVMGTPFQMGIADPLREHFNRVYKPSRFSVGQNIEAYQKQLITANEFVDNMRYLGWDDKKIEMLYAMSRKDLTDATLTKFYDLGLVSEDEVGKYVESRGYKGTSKDIVTYLITNKRFLDVRDDLVKETSNQFLAGNVLEPVLVEIYKKAGWKEKEITLEIQRLKSEKTRKALLSDTDIANAVEKDLYQWSEARGILEERGYLRKDADIFIKLRVPKDKWLT